MSEEDAKMMILRAEKTAFILGKMSGALFSLYEKCPMTELELRDDIYDAMNYLTAKCEELYYTYDFTKQEVTQ